MSEPLGKAAARAIHLVACLALWIGIRKDEGLTSHRKLAFTNFSFYTARKASNARFWFRLVYVSEAKERVRAQIRTLSVPGKMDCNMERKI